MNRARVPTRDDETVRASGDPTDAVRAELARLSARARQLGTASYAAAAPATAAGVAYEPHVMRNARGLYVASARLDEDARQQLQHSQGGQASIELFMAKQLGVDVEEQQRLLRQLERRQSLLAADLSFGKNEAGGITGFAAAGNAPMPTVGASVPAAAASAQIIAGMSSEANDAGVTEVDQLVGQLKRDIIAQSRTVLHQQQAQLLRERETALFHAAWEPYFVQLEGDLASQLMRSMEGDVLAGHEVPLRHGRLKGSGDVTDMTGDAVSGWTPETRARATLFALYVDRYPAKQWLTLFATLVQEQCPQSDLALLWQSVEQLLEPVLRQGSARETMTYVASSRHVLEAKAGLRLVTNILHISPANATSELDATGVLDAIVQASGSASSWLHVFHAMRVGRYDVAVLAAQGIGSSSLTSALQQYAQLTPQQRQRQPPATGLLALYNEPQTCTDLYRRAVLFILLAGQTTEGVEVTQRVLLELCGAVVTSLEDALWLRLCCVRQMHEGRESSSGVQSLSQLQKIIKDDLQAIVTVAHGDVIRLASFLIHACLPSSALRLLIDDCITRIDGIHMALCFRVCGGAVLDDIAAEHDIPFDFGCDLVRYMSALLLETERSRGGNRVEVPASAFFSYFDKTDLDETFVQWCQKDSVCYSLFAQGTSQRSYVSGINGSDDKASNTTVILPPLPERLLGTMSRIAEVAAKGQKNIPLALFVLLALAKLAGDEQNTMLQSTALRRAVQIINPALAQIFALQTLSAMATKILLLAKQLYYAISEVNASGQHNGGSLLTEVEANDFAALSALANVYQAKIQGDNEHALHLFFQLPFIPQKMQDIDFCVDNVQAMTTTVQAATAAIIPHILQTATITLEKHKLMICNNTYMNTNNDEQATLINTLKSVVDFVRRLICNNTLFANVRNDELLAFENDYLM